MRKRKGFTLVELIAVIMILGLLVSAGVFFIPFFKLLFYPPRQTDTIYVANLLVNYVTDANPYFKGLRFMRKITANGATATALRYLDANQKDIQLFFSTADRQLYYSIGGAAPKLLVYDAVERGVKIDGEESVNKIFKYIDVTGAEIVPPIPNPQLIQQIEFNWKVYTGHADPEKGDGLVKVNTAVEIRQFE